MIKDYQLYGMVAVLVLLILFVLILWEIIDPLQVVITKGVKQVSPQVPFSPKSTLPAPPLGLNPSTDPIIKIEYVWLFPLLQFTSYT